MAATNTQVFDIANARASFPALKQDHQVYFDNAGGSQVLGSVAKWYAQPPLALRSPALSYCLELPSYTPTNSEAYSIRDYLEETNVQLGATYDVAKQSTDAYNKGLEAAARFLNAHPDEIGITILDACPSAHISNLS